MLLLFNGNSITWLYDAAGVKLQKQTYEYANNTTNTKDYIGGIEYNNNTIEAIYTDEGRATPNGSTYRYEYTIKDHLGNSRVMFSDVNNDGQVDENEIIQEEHYYPFGLRHEGYGRTITHGENFYQFNGTEKVEDFDLAWHHTLFRSYDPTVGRWHQIDPKNSARESAYVGLGNNPVLYSDMLGDSIVYNHQHILTTGKTARVDGKEVRNVEYVYRVLDDGTYAFVNRKNNQVYNPTTDGDIGDGYLTALSNALSTLTAGAEGRRLVEEVAFNQSDDVSIIKKGSNNADFTNGDYVYWNDKSTQGGVNQNGNRNRPAYIALGHELAHIEDVKNRTINRNVWGHDALGVPYFQAEKYATHIENKIRRFSEFAI